jgi:hypothetical protein
MRVRLLSWAVLAGLVLAACGSSGGGGLSIPTVTTVSFTPGPTAAPSLIPGYTGPISLIDVEVNRHNGDANPDLLNFQLATWSGTLTLAETTNWGAGDGTFPDGGGGGGYGDAAVPRGFAASGDVLGAGEGGMAFAMQQSSGVVCVTEGNRVIGMSFVQVGGIGFLFSGATLDGFVVGDWDGDGTDDFAVSDWTNSRIAAFFSNPLPNSFAAVPGTDTALTAGTNAHELAALDADGDSNVDIAFVDAAGTFQVLLSAADGTFTLVGSPGTLGALNRSIRKLVAGDFDGDGRADLAGMLAQPGSPNRLFWCAGNGDGTFDPPVLSSIEPALALYDGHRYRVADLDLDVEARPDLAFVVPELARVVTFLADRTGHFVQNVDADFSGAGPCDSLAIGDVDVDGDVDLVVMDAAGLVVRTLFNDTL